MKPKVLLSIVVLTIATALPTTAMAKTTNIAFAKGSDCGSYSGDFKNRTFTIYLNKGQLLTIEPQTNNHIKNIVVKTPKGRTLENYHDSEDTEWQWGTDTTGKYSFKILGYPDGYDYVDMKICAYDF